MKIYLISFVFTALMPFLAQARNSTEERTAADTRLQLRPGDDWYINGRK